MSHTVSPTRWSRVRLVVLCLSVALAAAPPLARAVEKKPVFIEVLLPAEAELEVEGYKPKTQGETRRFESPPVQVGFTYAYIFKATWHGRSVERKVRLRAGGTVTVDMRQELQEAATPPLVSSFSLLVPPAMTLDSGHQAILPVCVKREHFPGSIRITFEKLPQGITIPDVTLPREQSETNATLIVAADAPAGTEEINIVASSGSVRDTSTIKLTIRRLEPKVETKPEIKPAPTPVIKPKQEPDNQPKIRTETKPATLSAKKPEIPSKPVIPRAPPAPESVPVLRVVTPDNVVLRPGQTKYLEMKVTMKNGEPLPAEPIVTLTSFPANGLTCAAWTASDFKGKLTAYTRGFAVKVAGDASEGQHEVKVIVIAGAEKVESTFKVAVEPIKQGVEAKAPPTPALRLVLPHEVVLQPGRPKYIEIQVKTADGSPLPDEPRVTLETQPDSRLRIVPWTAIPFKAGALRGILGFALTTEAGTPDGERQIQVLAVVGTGKIEGTVKATVQPLR